MTAPSTESSPDAPKHVFALRHLLIAVAVVAVPMALFARYWENVNDTVDERTIPFSDTGLQNHMLLYTAVVIVLLIAIGVFAWLLSRRSYFGALSLLIAYILCFPLLSSLTQSRIIAPKRGNPEAEIHNDAAAIVATAVDRFYARTQEWPRSWNDLDNDITNVIDEIVQKQKPSTADPFASAADPFTGDPFANEESQSIFSRAPDLGNTTAKDIRNLVDIDFDSDPKALAKMNWVEFDGIVPHNPAYNFYRVEFGKLIDRLNALPSSSEDSLGPAK